MTDEETYWFNEFQKEKTVVKELLTELELYRTHEIIDFEYVLNLTKTLEGRMDQIEALKADIKRQRDYILLLEHDVRKLNELTQLRKNEISGLQKILDDLDILINRYQIRKDAEDVRSRHSE